MNTISIFLAKSGSLARLEKDFPLYQGSFQNKLLDIYVPTSILAPVFTAQTASGTVTAEYVAATSVKIGMAFTSSTGALKLSKNYYVQYLNTVIVNEIEYAVYERFLPQEFTLYYGTGANAPKLLINVLNIETDVTPNVVLSVITSQTCFLDVLQSTNLTKDETIEATEFESLESRMNAVESVLPLKQNITEPKLETVAKTIPLAINEVNTKSNTNATNVTNNTTDISNLQTEVTKIKNTTVGAETPIGQMTGSTLPTNAELSAFVVQKKGREPRPNDSIIFVLFIQGETDKNYKYIYYDSVEQWNGYEIPPVEQASNGSLGTIKGTYGVGSTNPIIADIPNGELRNLYYKDYLGAYNAIGTKIDLLDQKQQDIIDGTQTVGSAGQAQEDQLGNVINTTYAEQANVYTKSESDEKFLPSTYTNTYHYATAGLVDDIPTTPPDGKQFIVNITSVGTHNIFNASKSLTSNYNFSKNSADNSSLWLMTDVDMSVELTLITTLAKPPQTATLLSVQPTGAIQFTANVPKLVVIPTTYSSLGSTELKANVGDTFTKTLDLFTDSSTPFTFTVYCNATYDSTFNLSAQSIVFDVSTLSGFKAIDIAESDWVKIDNNSYYVNIPQAKHHEPPMANYFLDLQELVGANVYQRIAFTPTIDTDGNITITAFEPHTCQLLIASNLTQGDVSVLFASQPEVDAGTVSGKAVAPNTLNVYVAQQIKSAITDTWEASY